MICWFYVLGLDIVVYKQSLAQRILYYTPEPRETRKGERIHDHYPNLIITVNFSPGYPQSNNTETSRECLLHTSNLSN